MNRLIKKQAYRIVIWQLFLIVGLALVLFSLKGLHSGLSVLSGGLAYALPTLLFVWLVFAYTTARSAYKFVVAFFAGEAVKLFFSAILFVLVVSYLPVTVVPTLIGYVFAIVSFWVVSSYFLCQQKGS